MVPAKFDDAFCRTGTFKNEVKSMFRGADEVNGNLCESVDFQRSFEAKEILPTPMKKHGMLT
jgi:hypothetical protein